MQEHYLSSCHSPPDSQSLLLTVKMISSVSDIVLLTISIDLLALSNSFIKLVNIASYKLIINKDANHIFL